MLKAWQAMIAEFRGHHRRPVAQKVFPRQSPLDGPPRLRKALVDMDGESLGESHLGMD